MKKPTIPANEEQRLQALQSYRILDSLPEQAFDDIVFIASQICQTSIALISLVDEDRQWFKAKVGLGVDQTPRDFSFCAHAINEPSEFFEVKDAHADVRFADNPLVQGDPHIRFYAAIPLKVSDDMAIGTLCVADQKHGSLSTEQIKSLSALSRQVMVNLALREEQKQLADRTQELEFSNQRLELALEGSQDAIWDWMNLEKDEVWWAPNFLSNLGYAPGEIEPDRRTFFRQFLHPEDKAVILNIFEESLRTKEPFDFECRMKHKQGDYHWFRFRGKITPGKSGQPARMSGSSTHIHEQKMLKTELSEAKRFLTKVMEVVPSIIYVFNQETMSNEYSNKELGNTLGYTHEEVKEMGENLMPTLIHPEDLPSVFAHFGAIKALKDGETLNLEYRIKHRDGQYRWLLSIDSVFERGSDGQVIKHLGIATDVTELKELLEEKSAMTKNLELKNQELRQLAYIATHDLKVPILNIQGHFGYLKGELPADNQDVQESVGFVDDSIQQFNNTIEGLTSLFRLKSEEVQLEVVNLQEIFQNIVPGFAAKLLELGGSITLDVDSNVNIVGSKMFCYSIFQNLIGNAMKYRSPDRPPIILLTGIDQGDTYAIAIQDNGIGIDIALHEKNLFGMFKRFHDHVEGTGMGMHMTKLMMESHGGSVAVESTVGEGTTITTTFKKGEA